MHPFRYLFTCLLLVGFVQQSQAQHIRLLSSDQTTSRFEVVLADWELKAPGAKGEVLVNLKGRDASPIMQAGAPDLPKISTTLVVPAGAELRLSLSDMEIETLENVLIVPSKGNLSREINPAEVPFEYGEIYRKNSFFPATFAQLQTPYQLRQTYGQPLWLYPFQYNPLTKQLRIVRKMQVEVAVLNPAQLSPYPPIPDDEFAQVYRSLYLNANEQLTYVPVEEEGSMLVLCHSPFMPTIQPFVNWKKQKGIRTTLVDMTSVGSQPIDIKSFIQSFYQNNPDLKYVLLVGDNQQIPCMTHNGNPSDNAYAYLSGNDAYPEVFMGRFSADNTTDLQVMIDRTINYEKQPYTGTGGFEKGVCIASNQGPGDNNQMDYEHLHEIRGQLLNYTYTDVTELYDGTQTMPGYTDAPGNPSYAEVVQAFDNQIGIVNYTGHGGTSDLVTSGFNVQDALSLENQQVQPFMWTVGCRTGEFMNATCLAEALIRARHPVTNKPTGTIANFMSTINQTWDPPMSAQDEMNAILTENIANNIKRSFGGLSFNGCMKMNDNYGQAGYKMTDTWTLFGDPSVMIFTRQPLAMTVSHAGSLPMGSGALSVNGSVEGAWVCVSQNNEILGTAKVNAGTAWVLFLQPLSSPNDLQLTVTAFNHQPYIGTITVSIPNSPYIALTAHSLKDAAGNNNQLADFGETVQWTVKAQNFGALNASGVNIQLSTTDPYLNITDATQSLGNIASNQFVLGTDAFELSISNDVPDQHTAQFTATATDNNGNSWTSYLSLLLNAPQLSVLNMAIDDTGGNNSGFFDPGETAILRVWNQNNGHAAANISGNLSCNHPLVQISNSPQNLGGIGANGATLVGDFTVMIDPAMPKFTPLTFSYTVQDGAYSAAQTFSTLVSPNLINFEPNSPIDPDWAFTGSVPWFISTAQPFNGSHCHQSGLISNGQTSSIIMVFTFAQADSISFYRRTSSEKDYDFLEFYIDNQLVEKWSGELPWERKVYFAGAGTHTFTWTYRKDPFVNAGADAVFLDDILLPDGALINAIGMPLDDRPISLFPNPASQKLQINLALKAGERATIKLLDVQGRELLQKEVENSNPVLEVGDLSRGLYELLVEVEGKIWTGKLWVE